MPWSNQDGALLGTGLLFIGGAVLAFKKKATVPFKAAYFFSWVTAGPAIIMLVQPDKEELEKKLRAKGVLDDASLDEARRSRQAQMDALR
ncbi:hypothetical protein CYMTET_31714 [Cymbomonas tetramitiformis]|uniref:Uncharacterized protein n=1 Tax=Cymbomonas tetramitiformis TaxID=36881 RepID=A0AAE0KSW6_9CHLO|nr:hypothetical protein CYMTET_31714 [Cymbomonas tetramitiformis]